MLPYTVTALQMYFSGEPNRFLCGRARPVPGPVAAAYCGGWLEPGARPAGPDQHRPPSTALSKRSLFPNANQNKQKCP